MSISSIVDPFLWDHSTLRERKRRMQHHFAEKVIIITGGSSGIGRATAHYFAQQGGSVLIIGRRADALKAAANQERIAWMVADISQQETANAVVAHALALWGHVDVVVNNAATLLLTPLEDITSEQMSTTFRTNVFGPTWLSKAALPALSQTRGSIVNVSSIAAQRASVPQTYYAASKAALEHLTRCWAVELAPRGIRVNAIAPGPTATPGQDAFLQSIAQDAKAQGRYDRRGTPEEVAAWIAAVADPQVKWLTGQVITVDGGIKLGAQLPI
jgi:NAD(P)-dependent dehydrogenase (short-subunit alcohol dehydrogenase family)